VADLGSEFYPSIPPLKTAFKARCPRCGQGPLFSTFLGFADECSDCRQDYSKIDAGDGPAVFVILIAGFLIVAAALYVEVVYQPPYWLHAVLWLPIGLALPIAMLRPMKAWLAAKQYQNNAALGVLDLGDET